MNLLDVERLDAYHGDLQALSAVSMSVAERETVAIIGANGAGKSTLLGTIAGLLPIRGGELRYDGTSLAGIPAHRRVRLGIALVPEGRRIFPSLTTEENLLVGAYAGRKGPWTMARVLELFPLLRDRRKRSAAVLSGGEQQALAIGRALMANPRLLLLDEVSLGLAPVVVKQLYAALPAITDTGSTIVLVEQNVDQALAVASRVYCLLEGRVALAGGRSQFTREQISAAYFGLH
jgi:branched-chain amino acid transport system ATP-binding protein